jgi:23S rRNA (pseudouridine1915-N3)-methyltransferase
LANLRIISIGKDKEAWVGEGCDHYAKMLSRFARIESVLLPALKNSASLSPEEIRAAEAERLEKAIGSGYFVAMHERGQVFDSPAAARRMQQTELDARGTISFVIGGAFGLDPKILKRAAWQWSLSPLTFSHDLARLILLEQLYRAYSILRGTAYHK